jgi:hypothetical protein
MLDAAGAAGFAADAADVAAGAVAGFGVEAQATNSEVAAIEAMRESFFITISSIELMPSARKIAIVAKFAARYSAFFKY